jgi:hypothetical protein
MVDTDGDLFKPGPFVRAYLTQRLFTDKAYLFLTADLIARRDFVPKLLHGDTGIALRPFDRFPRLEFRAGMENLWDIPLRDMHTGFFGEVRFIY